MPALVSESEQKTIPVSTATATQYVMAKSARTSSIHNTKDKLGRKALFEYRKNGQSEAASRSGGSEQTLGSVDDRGTARAIPGRRIQPEDQYLRHLRSSVRLVRRCYKGYIVETKISGVSMWVSYGSYQLRPFIVSLNPYRGCDCMCWISGQWPLLSLPARHDCRKIGSNVEGPRASIIGDGDCAEAQALARRSIVFCRKTFLAILPDAMRGSCSRWK